MLLPERAFPAESHRETNIFHTVGACPAPAHFPVWIPRDALHRLGAAPGPPALGMVWMKLWRLSAAPDWL